MWFRANSCLPGTRHMPHCPIFGHMASLGCWGGADGGMECGGLGNTFLIVIICLPARHKPSFGLGWGLRRQGRYGTWWGGSRHEINSLPFPSGMPIMCWGQWAVQLAASPLPILGSELLSLLVWGHKDRQACPLYITTIPGNLAIFPVTHPPLGFLS